MRESLRKHPRNPLRFWVSLGKRNATIGQCPFEFRNSNFFSFFSNEGEVSHYYLLAVRVSRVLDCFVLDPSAASRFEIRFSNLPKVRRSDLSMTFLFLFSWPWQCVSRTDSSILHSPTRFDGVREKRYPFWIPIRLSQTMPCSEYDRYISQTRHCETLRRHWNAETFQTILPFPFLT